MKSSQKEIPYFESVFEVVQLIPFGRAASYGDISNYLSLGSARMVGWAMNKSFSAKHVPAHRVVNRKGELSGRIHFPTPDMMQELLEGEGIKIEDHRIVDWEKVRWDPSRELL